MEWAMESGPSTCRTTAIREKLFHCLNTSLAMVCPFAWRMAKTSSFWLTTRNAMRASASTTLRARAPFAPARLCQIAAADQGQEREQDEAANGCAEQVEEVDAVHFGDGLGDGERENDPGDYEGQRGGEVDEREIPVGRVIALREDDRQRQQYEQAVERAEAAELGEECGAPSG